MLGKQPPGYHAARCCGTCRYQEPYSQMFCKLHTECLIAPWGDCDDWEPIPKPETQSNTEIEQKETDDGD